MKPSATFWNLLAKRYARSPVADQAAYERKLEITRGYLTPETKLLEFGCGTGSTAIVHAPNVDTLLAVDISPKMLAIAKSKAAEAGVTNITFETSSIDEFSRPKGSFDVILGMSILHLLADKEAVLKNVFDMLKPGGVFISSTVCVPKKWYLQLILPIGRPLGLFPLLRFFTADELINSIIEAGFEIEQNWQPTKDLVVFAVAKKPTRQK
jgi:2-polyprenyl-3-methyl-5-hydroxy-6-metoxy-1,4-benzoquinol methylase